MAASTIPTSVARRVRERAGDRCEYCGTRQELQEATFHIDHVIPRRSSGPSTITNLALACVSCSLRKGARESAVDPSEGVMARIFNPRVDDWADHFELLPGFEISGRTSTGRATVEALRMNRPLALAIRRASSSPHR